MSARFPDFLEPPVPHLACARRSLKLPSKSGAPTTYRREAGYGWSAGTSTSAPYVFGVVALIIGANGGSMAPNKVMGALKKSSEDLGKPGRDDVHGFGRINALNAVSQ